MDVTSIISDLESALEILNDANNAFGTGYDIQILSDADHNNVIAEIESAIIQLEGLKEKEVE